MAKREKVVIRGKEFELQSVSPRWYYELNDRYMGNRRNSAEYISELMKNTVISPAEIKSQGLDYFEENQDLGTIEELIPAIERFLKS